LINKEVQRALEHEQIVYQDFITTPTPFNDLLWYVIVKTNDGFYTGYRSVFDDSSHLKLSFFQHKYELTTDTTLPTVHEKLLALSQQYYVYSSVNDTVRINLVMFGQIAGWGDPDAPFVLACDLIPEETTMTLLQEGRLQEMDKGSISSLMNRIFEENTP
jgi:inner membrane protein